MSTQLLRVPSLLFQAFHRALVMVRLSLRLGLEQLWNAPWLRKPLLPQPMPSEVPKRGLQGRSFQIVLVAGPSEHSARKACREEWASSGHSSLASEPSLVCPGARPRSLSSTLACVGLALYPEGPDPPVWPLQGQLCLQFFRST